MFEFVGQSAKDQDNSQANPSRLINLYREPVISQGRSAYVLKSVLGSEIAAATGGIFVRAFAKVADSYYVVQGGHAQEADLVTGTVTTLGSVDDSVNASISGNNGDVTFVSGGKYYRWDGATLTQPPAGAFSSFGSVAFISNYTILTEKDGRRFQWSDIADASTLPGLNFSTADGRDDNLIRAATINGQLYLFKEESLEIWYVTGAAGASAFERQAGGVIDVGLKAHNLLTIFDGGAFMVATDGRAYMVGQGFTPVSTPPVETAIAQNAMTACSTYADEGHTFLCIHFEDQPSWCYDLATGEWHERGYDTALGAWGVVGAARREGVWYVARTGGNIERLVRSNMDATAPLVREAVSRTAEFDGEYFSLSQIELFPRQGFNEGTIELSLSRDGGVTYGSPKARTIGPVGNYGARVKWAGLGSFRRATAKIRISDAIETTMSAEMSIK